MYDINTVCKLLGVTSRTLRFWEQKKLITSTRTQFSSVRKYTEDQFEDIKRIIVLRSLGLSIKSIEALSTNKADLKNVIIQKRAELIASIVSRKKELDLLNEALMKIDTGESVFIRKEASVFENLDVVELFTDRFLFGDFDGCFEFFSDMMKEYLPLSAFKKVIADTLLPIGAFVAKKETAFSPS